MESEAYIASSAAVMDGLGYVGNFGNMVIAFDPKSGEIKWKYRDRMFPYYSSAALTRDRVIIGGAGWLTLGFLAAVAVFVAVTRDQLREIANCNLLAAPEVDRFVFVVVRGRHHDPVGRVLRVEKFARGRAVAPQHDIILCLDELSDHRRDDVTRFGIEVVARPVQIHGQQIDSAESILLTIGLQLHQQRLLRDSIRRVGLLWISIP